MPHATEPLNRTHRVRAPMPPGRSSRRPRVPCVAPNRWCHEVPALIGPFCCQANAVAFARPPVEFGHYEGQRRQVERWGDGFYVHVR